jgi:hypothetical protein
MEENTTKRGGWVGIPKEVILEMVEAVSAQTGGRED